MKLFGERLKTLRIETEIGQKELGEMIGKSRSTIANYENGSREPSFEILVKICSIFDVSADYLLGREAKKITKDYKITTIDEHELIIEKHGLANYSVIKMNDLYVIISDSETKSGDLVLIEQEGYQFKRIHKSETGLILQSLEDKNDVDFYSLDELSKIDILGKVVETRKIY
ncbi:helix-turn-helix domain-containing protein [Vallitalea guaymasensis]|uniref:helix-turn-helix domain-containing protein n=1 Tax=Vallitalea guaymasensis TaxID=1185412 RepID=UPI000DE29A53|nr:helix-turn-helix transcriptional regulator [Vallitalea guaymasensis]